MVHGSRVASQISKDSFLLILGRATYYEIMIINLNIILLISFANQLHCARPTRQDSQILEQTLSLLHSLKANLIPIPIVLAPKIS